MMSRKSLASATAFLAFFLNHVAAAADFPRSGDLCVLPVFGGSPGELDQFELDRLVRRTVVLPGLAGPVIYSDNQAGSGVWTVADGTFQRFGGPFPQSALDDKFAVDARTGRIIGLNARGEVFAADSGTRIFRHLASPNQGGRAVFGALSYLPHRQAIVFGYENKLYRLDGEKAVLITDRLPFPFLAGDTINDLPKLDAMLVTVGGGGIVVVHDNGELEVIREPKAGSHWDVPTVVELPDPARVLVRTNNKILVLSQTQPPPARVMPELRSFDVHVRPQANQTSTVTGGYLLPSMNGLWRLGSEGYERVLGGEKIGGTARLYDIPTFGIAVVSEGVLHAFDGHALSLIPGSGVDRTGAVNGIHDLRSIGKVLVAGTKGVFELTPQRTLVPIPLPASPDDNGIRIVEMPRSRAAILLVSNSAYAIDQSGQVRILPGGDDLGFPPYPASKPIGLVAATNELLFEGPGSMALFRVIDRRTAGDAACASTERPRPPASALCFRQIEGADDRTLNMFSDWAMSPEGDRLLVSGSKGLLQIAKDRSFVRVADLGPEYSGKPIELPWDGSVFVGAVGTSSSVILEKSGRVRPVQGEAKSRSDTFRTSVALPSLKTMILGSGGAYSGYGFRALEK